MWIYTRIASTTCRWAICSNKANNLTNFSAFLEKALDELFIDRMEGNEDIFSRVMTDEAFRSAAQEHLAREIFDRVRGADVKSPGQDD